MSSSPTAMNISKHLQEMGKAARADFPYLLALTEFFWNLSGSRRTVTSDEDNIVKVDEQCVSDTYSRAMGVFRSNVPDKANGLIAEISAICKETKDPSWKDKLTDLSLKLTVIKEKEGPKHMSFHKLKTKLRQKPFKNDAIWFEPFVYGSLGRRSGHYQRCSYDTTLDTILLTLTLGKHRILDLRRRPHFYVISDERPLDVYVLERLSAGPMNPASLGQKIGVLCDKSGIAWQNRANRPISLLCVEATWNYPHLQMVNERNDVVAEMYTLWHLNNINFILKSELGVLYSQPYLDREWTINAVICWAREGQAQFYDHLPWRSFLRLVHETEKKHDLLGKEWWIRNKTFSSDTYERRVDTSDGRRHGGGLYTVDLDEMTTTSRRSPSYVDHPASTTKVPATLLPPDVQIKTDGDRPSQPVAPKKRGWMQRYVTDPVKTKLSKGK